MNAKCQNPGCKRSNASRVEITNPRDYSVTVLLLCAPCRRERGVAVAETVVKRTARQMGGV